MSYRLVDANKLAIKYPEVNDMPCIYADLPNGLDGNHYTLGSIRKVIEDIKTEIAGYTLSDDEKTDMDEDSIKWGIKIAYDIIDKLTNGDIDEDRN